ncbi:MAG: hypothetical protein HOE90_01835 [Bacteriovoracaceae bacterium]|nr:hypothetical protein [Bacteriovoracaceae bacterium]
MEIKTIKIFLFFVMLTLSFSNFAASTPPSYQICTETIYQHPSNYLRNRLIFTDCKNTVCKLLGNRPNSVAPGYDLGDLIAIQNIEFIEAFSFYSSIGIIGALLMGPFAALPIAVQRVILSLKGIQYTIEGGIIIYSIADYVQDSRRNKKRILFEGISGKDLEENLRQLREHEKNCIVFENADDYSETKEFLEGLTFEIDDTVRNSIW